MTRWRRFAAAGFVACVAWLTVTPSAHAGDDRPIKFVVPATPGAGFDIMARRIAKEFAVVTGGSVVVENRPGGNTLIGADAVARSAPDGHTLFYGATAMVLAPLLQKNSIAVDGLVPVIYLSTETYGIAVKQESPISSLQDLERLAAARPQGLNCATVPGAASLGCEQLKVQFGGRVTVIPFTGGIPAIESVANGDSDLIIATFGSLLQQAQAGRLRLLGVTERDVMPPGMPSVPVISDTWKGFFIGGYSGIYAPKDTPADRLRQLNRDFNAVLRTEEVRQHMRQLGQKQGGGSPDRLDTEVRRLQAQYREVIQRLGADPR